MITLYKHQQKCADLALLDGHNRYAFYLDTGTGKTITSLEIINQLPQNLRWLVITPKNVIESWIRDAKEFPGIQIGTVARYKDVEYLKQITNKARRADCVQEIVDNFQCVLINPKLVISRKVKGQKKKKPGIVDYKKFDGLVIDESSMLRDPKSSISRFCIKMSDHVGYVFLLSGTPAPNKPFEFFAQMRCIDVTLFGKSDYKFKQKYGYQDKFHKWHHRKSSESEILNIVKEKAIFVKKRDVLDLPPITEIERYVTEDSAAQIERAEYEDLLQGDGFDVSQLMKFRTLASGFIYKQDLATGARIGVKRLNYEKRNLAQQMTREIGNHRVIIWIQFKEDVNALLPVLGRYQTAIATSDTNTQRELDFFCNHSNSKYLIAHPRSIGVGVDGLQKVCNYCIFYNTSYSYDEYYQAISRLDRNGQRDPITVFNLITLGSIEIDLLAAIKKKLRFQDFVREKLNWRN